MKGKQIMKTVMNILVLSVLLVYLAPAQAQNYEMQPSNSAFQSTSTMMGSGSSLSSNPTLNENGVASAPSYDPAKAGSRPRKVGGLPGKPENEKDDEGNTPLGDAVLPLLAFALMFCGYVAIRRRRAVNG